MKRIFLTLCLFGTALTAFAADYRMGGRPEREYWVIGSNAPGTMKRGGPNVWLCTGTRAAGGDRANLQAAINAADAAGGGAVHVVGTLYVELGTETDIVFVADTVDKSAGGVLSNFTFSQGTIDDIVEGYVLRCSGGTDGGADSIEDNHRDGCYTVTESCIGHTELAAGAWNDAAKTLTETDAFLSYSYTSGDQIYVSGGTDVVAGYYTVASKTNKDTIVLSTDINGATGNIADVTTDERIEVGEDFDGESYQTGAARPTWVRMRGAIHAAPNVHVVGCGVNNSAIVLADQQNCCVIIGDSETSATLAFAMSNIMVDGNRANQGDEDTIAPYTFHPECNGIVLSDNYWDSHFSRMVVVNCDGDGFIILNPWGFHLDSGGWTEWHSGSGVVLGSGTDPSLVAHKVAQCVEANARDAHASNRLPGDGNTFTAAAILLRGVARGQINPEVIKTDYLHGIWDWMGFNNRYSNVDFNQSESTANNSGLYLDGKTGSVTYGGHLVTGCLFWSPTAATVPDGIRVNLPGCSIVGNVFRLCPKPIQIELLYYDGTVANNIGAFIVDDARSVDPQLPEVHSLYLQNTSGGTLANRRWVKHNADDGEMTLADASESATTVVGFLRNSATNGSYGVVQIAGYHPQVDIDDTINHPAIAVGDPLCCSDNTQGALEPADASGNWVVAKCKTAIDPAGGGTVVQTQVYILHPHERYAIP